MTRIAHIADIHLGIGYPGPNPTARLDEVRIQLNGIVASMKKEGVQLCVFAGDFFKDSRVMLDRAAKEISAVTEFIDSLVDADIYFLGISGTPSHDAVAAYSVLQEIYRASCWVTIMTRPEIKQYGSKLSVVGIPGSDRAQIASKDEFKGLTPAQLHSLMSDKLVDIAQGLRVRATKPAVLVAHYSYEKGDFGYDQLVMCNEAILPVAATEGFELVCLGHVHIPAQIDEKVFYSGSINRYRFNDEGVSCGYWIHDISDEGRLVNSTFIDTLPRRFVTLDLTAGQDFIAQQVNAEDIRAAMVRVRVTGDEAAVKQFCGNKTLDVEAPLMAMGAYHVASVTVSTGEDVARARQTEATEGIGPKEAVALWAAAQKYDKHTTDDLLLATESLLTTGSLLSERRAGL